MILCQWVICSQNFEEHSAFLFKGLDVARYLNARFYTEGIGAHGKIILKYILKKQIGKV